MVHNMYPLPHHSPHSLLGTPQARTAGWPRPTRSRAPRDPAAPQRPPSP